MEKRKVMVVEGVSVEEAVRVRKEEGRSLNTCVYLAGGLDFDAMACISPVCLRIGKALQFVPCGKCNFCLASRRADWSFRLNQELKVAKSAYFLTMTYDEPNVPWTDTGQSLCKRDLTLFTKSLRKFNVSDLVDRGWPALRYYSVGEYGSTTLRPHYHSIIFNLSQSSLEKVPSIWKRGHVEVGDVNASSIHYVTKYVVNRVGKEYEGLVKPFCFISKGLGRNYVESNRAWHKGDVLRNYVMQDGFKMRMPRYYKDRTFSVREKESIAKECLLQMTEASQLEVLRLSKVHPNPYNYLYDRLVAAYDSITKEDFKSDAL